RSAFPAAAHSAMWPKVLEPVSPYLSASGAPPMPTLSRMQRMARGMAGSSGGGRDGVGDKREGRGSIAQAVGRFETGFGFGRGGLVAGVEAGDGRVAVHPRPQRCQVV